MKFEKQPWGGYRVWKDDKSLGYVEKVSEGIWETNDGESFSSRGEAAQYLLDLVELKPSRPIPEVKWISADEIRSLIGEKEFKIKVYKEEITILESELGQPRLGEPILGSRMFRLRYNA